MKSSSSSFYRLIWFQHLHKAAGTYIVHRAKVNGEIFWEHHHNANPLENQKFIPLWDMGKRELTRFVDRCEEQGVTFIACEWGGGHFETLAKDPRVFLLTCLRDPVKRMISNYNYDYYFLYTHAKNYYEYIQEGKLFSSPDYYIRIFSQQNDPATLLTDEHEELAKKNLKLFDKIIILEKGMMQFDELEWKREIGVIEKKQSFEGYNKLALQLFKKFQFKKSWEYSQKIKHLPPSDLNLEKLCQKDKKLYSIYADGQR